MGVSLFDPQNNLVWSGTTDQDGSASFVISFTENNWRRKWRLDTVIDGEGISREVGFLTSTPILLSTTGAEEGEVAPPAEGAPVLVVGIVAIVVILMGALLFLKKRS